jgi:hypothetical protein
VNQFIKKSLIGLVVFGLVLSYLNYPIQGVSAQQDERDIEDVIKGYDVFDGIGMDGIQEIKRDNLQRTREQNTEDIVLDTATVGGSSDNVSGYVSCSSSGGSVNTDVLINGTNVCSIIGGTITSVHWSFSAASGHSFSIQLNCVGSGTCTAGTTFSGASCTNPSPATLSVSTTTSASASESCTVS